MQNLQNEYLLYLQECESTDRCPLTFDTWYKSVSRVKPVNADKYPHYFPKLPDKTSHLDVYRVCDSFGVKRSAVAHAVKKLLCSGLRGVKNEMQDLIEARDSIDRALEMLREETVDE